MGLPLWQWRGGRVRGGNGGSRAGRQGKAR
jgi:hypothetical protein